MELLLFIVGVIAILALRRAIRAEHVLRQQRIEVSQLRSMVQTLSERVERATASSSPLGASDDPLSGVTPSPAAGALHSPREPVAPKGSPAALQEVEQQPIETKAAAATQPGEMQPGEMQPGEMQPGEMQPGEMRPLETQTAPEVELPGILLPPAQVPASVAVAAYAAAASDGTTGAAGPAGTTATGGRVASSAADASPTPETPRASRQRESIESRIGGRWLLYIGIAALVLANSYFVKYAFDNEWVNQPMRIVLGLVAGAALTFIGQRFVQAGYTLYGQALSGGGVGILFLAVFAAHRWYELIARPVAFAGMVLITALGAWLADRQRSQLLAVTAVTVGFATPFLIGGDADAEISLFTYDATLVAGTLFLARRRSWPGLDLISYVLTVLTIVTWADVYYAPSAYLVTELFLTLFLVLFLFVLREHWSAASINPLAALVQVTLSLAPLLYHAASLTILFPHTGPLFVYLIVFTMAGLILARMLAAPWLRVVIWIGAAVPFYVFVEQRVPSSWIVPAWITLIGLYGLHVLAQAHRLDDDRPRLPGTEVFLLHAGGLWLLFCVEALLTRSRGDWAASAAFLLAAWYGGLAAAAWRWHRDAALHALGWASALVAIGCAIQFAGPWLTVALGTEGAVLTWLGLQTRRQWIRACGGLLLGVATLRALALLSEPASLYASTLLNARALPCLFIAGLMYALAWLHARYEVTPGATSISRASLIIAANLLTLVVASSEIDAFFDRRAWEDGAIRGAGAVTSADLTRQLILSITWAVYAVVLVAIGIWRNYQPVRLLAIVVFALTIAKVFLIDIARLDRVYKMVSMLALGILLLIASYLYQRLRTEARVSTEARGT